MKKIILLIVAIVFQSCYTLKPDSRSLSIKDYNERQQISNPTLVKKRNPIGVSFNIITPIVAGAAMYQYVDPVAKYQDGTETKGIKPANAAIGVIGMMAINKIVDYAMGYNKEKNLNEISLEKWTKKTKLNTLNNFIWNDNYTELTIIPKSKESNFEVRNSDDVVEFKTFFENASEENNSQMVKKAILVLEQEDLVTLIDLFSHNIFSYDAKVKYIQTSRSYNELWLKAKNYPEAKVDLEFLASELIILENQYIDYSSQFTNSKYSQKIENRLIDIDNKSFQEFALINTKQSYRNYINKFLNPYNLDEAQKRISAIEQEEARVAEEQRQAELARIEVIRLEKEALEKNRSLVSQFIEIGQTDYKMADGDGYTFWEQIQTAGDINLIKRNLLVIGEVSNKFGEPLKIKIKVRYNFIVKTEVTALVFFNKKTSEKKVQVSEYFIEVPAFSKIPFITLFRAKLESQGWGSGLLGGTSVIDVDREKPIDIEVEYLENIPYGSKQKQDELLQQFKLSGNAVTYDNWSRESLYQNYVNQNESIDSNCKLSNAKIYFDVENELEGKSTIYIEDKSGIEYKYVTTNNETDDSVDISSNNNSVVGEYTFTYSWNIGESDFATCKGTFKVPNCKATNYTITISNITNKVISVRAN